MVVPPKGKRPCASGAHGAQEDGTRTPCVRHGCGTAYVSTQRFRVQRAEDEGVELVGRAGDDAAVHVVDQVDEGDEEHHGLRGGAPGHGGARIRAATPVAPRALWSFYISYRGFYAATRPPGARRDPGSPSQATWVGEDRTWPPCPRFGRGAPRTLAHRAPWGARKRRRSGSSNDMRLTPPACSEPAKRARMGTGPAQRQSCSRGGHVPHMHRTLQKEIRSPPPK